MSRRSGIGQVVGSGILWSGGRAVAMPGPGAAVHPGSGVWDVRGDRADDAPADDGPARAPVRGWRALCRGVVAAAVVGALAACEGPMLVPGATVAPAPATAPARDASGFSERSLAMRAAFERQERALVDRGFLRTDGGGPDTPVTASMLAENFVRIALYDEYSTDDGVLRPGPVPSRLRRWETPVRMRLEFSDAVPEAQRTRDTIDVRAYAARLSRLTGHPIRLLDAGSPPGAANFHVLVLDDASRRAAGPRLRELVPGIDPVSADVIVNMPPGVFCLVVAFAPQGSSSYTGAVAVVRAELPDLTRLACYQEEIAQGLGLPNDSDHVRPSLFNDSLEFARLTRHDELLLRMLYDPRLRPGMREAEARPIVRRLASELLGGES